jgi:hypothetical protein
MDILLAVPFFNGSFKNGRRSFHLVDYVSNVVEEFPSCFVMIWFDFRLRKPRTAQFLSSRSDFQPKKTSKDGTLCGGQRFIAYSIHGRPPDPEGVFRVVLAILHRSAP